MRDGSMAGVSLSLLVLKTRQVENLRRFYGLIGVELTEKQHGRGPVHYAGRVGDVVFEVYPLDVEGASPDTTTRLGFTVESLTHVMEALATAGQTVVANHEKPSGDTVL
jgi:lactoylglutathione lyase